MLEMPQFPLQDILADKIAVQGRQAVTAAVPCAAAIGLSTLLQGGNAYDAAVAACMAESVALPMKCGLGGDLIAIVWEEGKAPEVLISVGRGGAAIDQGARLTVTGGASVGAPGAAQGYAALATRGVLGLAAVTGPAVALAEEGVPWSAYAVTLTQEAASLLTAENPFQTRFMPDGILPMYGDRLQLPGLAQLLRQFGASGAALWSTGAGDVLLRRLKDAGGLLAREDLEQSLAVWSSADQLMLSDKDETIWATPAPTHGADLLEAIRLVRQKKMKALDAVLRVRDKGEKPRTAAEFTGTSVVTAADARGTAVVVVHSNSFPQYGSGVVVPEFDLVLNNRPGRGFDLSAEPDAPNAPKSGRTPKVTLHAWAARQGARRYLGATPGGLNQLPWNLQTLLPILDGSSPQQAILRPRWQLSPKGGNQLRYEEGYPGIQNAESAYLSMRSASQVLSCAEPGSFWQAAADPRTGACAVAA